MNIHALLALAAVATTNPLRAFDMETASPVTHLLQVGDIIACMPTATGEMCELLCALNPPNSSPDFSETRNIPDMHWDLWRRSHLAGMSNFFDDWERISMRGHSASIESSDIVRLHARLPDASSECQTAVQSYACRGYRVSFVARTLRATPIIYGEWRAGTTLGNVAQSLRMHDLATWIFPNRIDRVANETTAHFSHMTIGVDKEPLLQLSWACAAEQTQFFSSLFCDGG